MYCFVKCVVVSFLFILMINTAKASDTIYIDQEDISLQEFNHLLLEDSVIQQPADSIPLKVKFKKGKAILFTLFTGFLGGHRIYLGTHHRTPILYSITLGGLGILPIIDLIHIVFTKDISIYENKSEIIMWTR